MLLQTGLLWLQRAAGSSSLVQRMVLSWWLLLCGAPALHSGLGSFSARAQELWLPSSPAQASLLRGMWDHPGPGIESVFPALAGRFLTTGSPGESLVLFLNTASPHLLSFYLHLLGGFFCPFVFS